MPSKNENILKSVTIDGTLCKRVNRCDRVASMIFFATNPGHTSNLRILLEESRRGQGGQGGQL
ncbi:MULTISPECIES: hypothetical protein [Calothrix]|uniref:Transposase n=1 Tax=Calothrix parietina FACHB-288 TaxID=2692896 RepID=A0ABR8AD46_9CYAN|nr:MULTISPECIES: hypothetical protein [Calothrix]MBD2197838.1 hypothetical protein [Calothrix parietina FACHB-288]